MPFHMISCTQRKIIHSLSCLFRKMGIISFRVNTIKLNENTVWNEFNRYAGILFIFFFLYSMIYLVLHWDQNLEFELMLIDVDHARSRSFFLIFLLLSHCEFPSNMWDFFDWIFFLLSFSSSLILCISFNS